MSYSDDEPAFRGVFPLHDEPQPSSTKRRRRNSAATSSNCGQSTAFFYQGARPALAAEPLRSGSPEAEAEAMAAMGLPTSLRPHTHFAGRNAEYEVYARDDEAPSTEATSGVEEEPAAARDGHEPAARQPRGRRKKSKS